MAKILVFDTETTSLDKPFCYDVGYLIIDSETTLIEKEEHYVIEQTWHNLPLFESAYYKDKRPLYVQLMRAHKAKLVKWGYMTQALARDIKNYEITDAYAYNSPFDDKVFSFNCDWFKTLNPFDNVAIHDIRGYASEYITGTAAFQNFCEENNCFTDTGNYSGTAETVYRFITENETFVEAHMGAMDSEIEAEILLYCLEQGAELATDYKVKKILTREKKCPFTVKINNRVIYKGEYSKKYVCNDVYNFTVEG